MSPESDASSDAEVPRKLSSVACDSCRVRKKRCVRQTDPQTGEDCLVLPCKGCIAARVSCTMNVPQKRRGPKLGQKRAQKRISDISPAGPSSLRHPNLLPPPSPGVQPISPDPLPPQGFPAFLSRRMIHSLIDEYRRSFRCIMPQLHVPSLLGDLYEGRECRPGQEDWIASVVALVAMTLLVLPHALPELSPQEKLSIIKRSQRVVTDILAMPHQRPSLERARTTAFMSFMQTIAGNIATAREYHGRTYSLLLELRLHDSQTYSMLDPRDRETALRSWWSFYCADRAIACFEGNHCLLAESHAPTLALPSVLEDEIMEDQRFDPSISSHEWLLGLSQSVGLYKLVGPVLEKRSVDRSTCQSRGLLQSRIADLDGYLYEVEQFQEKLPPPLRSDYTGETSSLMSINRSNILTSVQSLQYFGAQYLGELYVLLSLQTATVGHGITRRCVANFLTQQTSDHQESVKALKRAIWTDTLGVLQSTPIESLAINSLPGLWKIRYIAAGLLDDLDDALVPGIEEPSERQQAREQLVEYLKLLSALQEQISLENLAAQNGGPVA